MIFICSKKTAALKKVLESGKKDAWVEVLSEIPKANTMKEKDSFYLDISGFSQAEIKKAVGQLKKSNIFWGIIDPKAESDDPSLFFFEGAGDYISSSLFKKGLTKKRFDLAYSCAREIEKRNKTTVKSEVTKEKRNKLNSGKFKGWKSIRSGSTDGFLFLYVSLDGEASLRSIVGDNSFAIIQSRLREVLKQWFKDTDALLWMETEADSLFLIPPVMINGRTVVEQSLKLLLNSRMIVIDKLGLSIPVDFSICLHYGKTKFQPPGKTGTVVSEAVNYIFHLGMKRAETGRLTISGEVPEEIIQEELSDLFKPAGEFEGISLCQSKRFIFK